MILLEPQPNGAATKLQQGILPKSVTAPKRLLLEDY